MVVWLRPEYILAFITSLYYCSELVLSKTYDKFWCATEEGLYHISCPDETELLTDISIRKVYRRTQTCEPDDHSEYLIHCQSFLDISLCEGNKTCSIAISSRDYIQCADKTYTPTYFFVKYTCTQIHTMCTDTIPIRNTLYGYIVSPAYPYPMADNLKCSLSIEADPTMYIELSPIQIQLQDGIKCRSEYIEIFGYDSSNDQKNINEENNWKAYHIWCGTDRSANNPLSNARYLITSNSLYISLHTTVSKKPRYFKIRYKIVPSTVRSYYNTDGIAFDSIAKGQMPSEMALSTSINIIPTTMIIPSLNNSEIKNPNRTGIKRLFKKEILIGIIAGVVALLIAIIAGVLVFVFIKRRRSSSNTGKKTGPSTTSNPTSKSTVQSSDKAPLLEQTNNTSAAAPKRKLVPERTVQISEASSSRFKSNDSSGIQSGSAKPDTSASKPTLTAADSGIYGADLSEETITTTKPIPSSPKIHALSSLEASPSLPIVVINPATENSTTSAIVLPDNIEIHPTPTIDNKEKELVSDQTIQSAYPSLIDATMSENEGTICGSSLQSRRTSDVKSTSSIIQDLNHIETIVISEPTESLSHHIIPFNPLHVILKKDATKYYTTEYI